MTNKENCKKRIIEMKRLLDAVERIENGEDVNEAGRADNIDAGWLAYFVGGSSSFLPSYKQTACNLENQESKSRFIHKLFGYGYYPLINFDESFEKLQKLLTPREYGILEMLVMKGQTEDECSMRYRISPGSVRMLENKAIQKIKNAPHDRYIQLFINDSREIEKIKRQEAENAKLLFKLQRLEEEYEELKNQYSKKREDLIFEYNNQLKNMNEELKNQISVTRSNSQMIFEKCNEMLGINCGIDDEWDSSAEYDTRSIDILELSTRCYNVFKRAEVNLIHDILRLDNNDLRKLKNFGDTCIKETAEKMRKIGYADWADEIERQEKK